MNGIGGQINNEFDSWYSSWFDGKKSGKLLMAIGDSRIQGGRYRDVDDVVDVPNNDFSIQVSL